MEHYESTRGTTDLAGMRDSGFCDLNSELYFEQVVDLSLTLRYLNYLYEQMHDVHGVRFKCFVPFYRVLTLIFEERARLGSSLHGSCHPSMPFSSTSERPRHSILENRQCFPTNAMHH